MQKKKILPDEQDVVTSNLIESCNRLMAFWKKHLNDSVINGAINKMINGVINLSETDRKLLHFLKENPHATKPVMASTIGVGAGTIERAIKKQKSQFAGTRRFKQNRLLERD